MPENNTCMWLQEFCGQVEAEVVSNSRNKLNQTTYKYFFQALYVHSAAFEWHFQGTNFNQLSATIDRFNFSRFLLLEVETLPLHSLGNRLSPSPQPTYILEKVRKKRREGLPGGLSLFHLGG